MNHEGYSYYEISIDTTRAGMQRLGEALLRTGAGLECGPLSRMIPHYPLGRGISATLIVQVPSSAREEFFDICRPNYMAKPAKAQVQCSTPGRAH